MNWKRLLIAAATRKKYKAFLTDTNHPEQARERLWTKEIVPVLHQSVYWQSQLKNPVLLDDFAITTYEDYEQGLLAAQHHQTQPFNGEEVIFWSETSGTAGVRKFFPITSSFQNQFQRTMAPYIHNLTQLCPGLFQEKMLYLAAVDAIRPRQEERHLAGLAILIIEIYLLLSSVFMLCLMKYLLTRRYILNGHRYML